MTEHPWHVGTAFERELFCGDERMATCTTRQAAVEIAAVMNVHASAEPVAYRIWDGQSWTLATQPHTCRLWEPLYAAPPAPEPLAKVEWRVSEEEARQLAASYPEVPGLDDLVGAYLDTRAALARRPDPAPATPVIDETRRLLAEMPWSERMGRRLRAILAEHDAVARTGAGGWREVAVEAIKRLKAKRFSHAMSAVRDGQSDATVMGLAEPLMIYNEIIRAIANHDDLPAPPANNAGGER